MDNPRLVYEEIPYTTTNSGDLGDSITEGHLVKRGKTFSDLLEIMLNKKATDKGSNLRYEVMNFGVIGYNLEAKVETLKTKVIHYQPDIVVLNYFNDDLQPFPNFYAFISNDSSLVDRQKNLILNRYVRYKYSLIQILYSSRLFILLKEVLFNRKNFHWDVITKELQKPAPKYKKIIYQSFLTIKRLQNQHNFKFFICLHPDLIHGYDETVKTVIEFAEKFRFPYFYMWDYYKSKVED
ncbi:MAG: SGNH/GDSL hydrolase family protein, partial [Candidatus Omnitrophica bacterium]|nr:SGNH/GDSL hydrolase family protein [Candidatus Omnitrophota bacterium]